MTACPPFVAQPCGCGHRACRSWVVTGLAAEATMTEAQARAVAAVLDNVPADATFLGISTKAGWTNACLERNAATQVSIMFQPQPHVMVRHNTNKTKRAAAARSARR